MAIRVLLAEDHKIIRKVIADLLREDPHIELIAESGSFNQTIELVSKLHPQVILMDVHMTDERIVTRSQLRSSLKGSRLLAMSIWTDDETKALAESFGAVALLDKTKLANDLISAVRRAMSESEEA